MRYLIFSVFLPFFVHRSAVFSEFFQAITEFCPSASDNIYYGETISGEPGKDLLRFRHVLMAPAGVMKEYISCSCLLPIPKHRKQELPRPFSRPVVGGVSQGIQHLVHAVFFAGLG